MSSTIISGLIASFCVVKMQISWYKLDRSCGKKGTTSGKGSKLAYAPLTCSPKSMSIFGLVVASPKSLDTPEDFWTHLSCSNQGSRRIDLYSRSLAIPDRNATGHVLVTFITGHVIEILLEDSIRPLIRNRYSGKNPAGSCGRKIV